MAINIFSTSGTSGEGAREPVFAMERHETGAGRRSRSMLPLLLALPLVLVPLRRLPGGGCWIGASVEAESPPPSDRPEESSAAPGLLPGGLQLAVFDLAGTTLDDRVNGQPLAIVAICEAFAGAGVQVDPSAVTRYRGLEKREAIRQILGEMGGGDGDRADDGDDAQPRTGQDDDDHDAQSRKGVDQDELVEEVYARFTEALDGLLRTHLFSEIPGTTAAFSALHQQGAKIVIGSGFAIHVVQDLVGRLGWDVDHIVFAQRPQPDAIQKAMRIFNVSDRRAVLKVGDTVADVEEGRAAGVFTVAVLTGTQPRASLEAAGPDLVLGTVGEIPGALPSSVVVDAE